jgi:primase-polymerase (primpol)-like protein
VNLDQLPDPEPPSRPSANGEAAGADHLAQIRIHLDVDGVPGALMSIAQWVGWRIKAPDKPGGKIGKVPVNPHTGRDASTTDPSTWGTFDAALDAAQRHRLAGVGFVFTEASGVVGVDLDKCRNPDTGEIAPWAAEIVAVLDSFTEISPSGTGVHVLACGSLPSRGRRRGPVEMYSSARFFTMTGVVADAAHANIERRDAQLMAVHAKWIGSGKGTRQASLDDAAAKPDEVTSAQTNGDANGIVEPPDPDATAADPAGDGEQAPDDAEFGGGWTAVRPRQELTDDELLMAARKAKNGAKFSALFDRGETGLHASHSEADFALCAQLAFWTGPDAARIDRLFRQSKLCREKWDEPRGETSYGAQTIDNVLAKATEFRKPPSPSRHVVRWTRRIENLEVVCEPQGRQSLTIRATSADGRQFVDRLQFATESGRQRVAERLASEHPHLDQEQIGDALEELAAQIMSDRAEAADGTDGTDGCFQGSLDSSDAGVFASLVIEAEDVELFHTPGKHDAEAFATIEFDGHRETWPVRSQAFKYWALRRYREREGKTPSGTAVTDGMNAIAAAAIFDGGEHPVFVRIASHEGAVFIDLGDDSWSAVRVTENGWTVVPSNQTPVRFCRRRGMQALPVPLHGGSVDQLRRYVNLPDDGAWKLFVLVLVTYLLPRGPYVVLVVNGEQGSAKSALMRVARDLIDPNKAGLRRPPKDERDLMIAATNAWIVAYDNISGLPAFLSDAICVLATGGGFGARQLFSDDEEKLFEATRPVMLNGIEDIATRADLLDRSVIFTLTAISDEARMEESEQRSGFESVRACVFGALLSGVVAVLARKAGVKLKRRPRMADFATNAVAASAAFGWSDDEVLDLIERSRRTANDVAIGNSLVAEAILRLLSTTHEWRGSCGQLLEQLSGESDPVKRVRAGWPKTARGMRGALTRAAPNLRRAGVELDFARSGQEGQREVSIRKGRGQPSVPSAPSATRSDDPENGDLGRRLADGQGGGGSQPSAPNRHEIASGDPENADSQADTDGTDGTDGRAGSANSGSPECSEGDDWEVVP